MNERIWLGFGFVAQGIFAFRFIYQWIVSERRGESMIPVGFWYLSLGGGLLLLGYAIHRRDPVFIVGQGSGVLVYIRNLVLIRKKNTQKI